jgi:LmbE family N-acetylglucosaminyl deacetylase
MRVLVVAAHPDDEVLGCGGTIARLTEEGHDVSIVIVGEGITSRLAGEDDTVSAELRALREDGRRAASDLGVSDLRFLGFPDNRLDTVPLLDVVKSVEAVLGDVRARAVLTHHGGDLNVDHQVVHRAVLTATRPTRGESVTDVLAFEIASSTEWAFQQFEPAFRANLFVDVEATLERKIAALRRYEGEVREFPHPRSPEALRAIAARWGGATGTRAAEAFELIRGIRRIGDGPVL